MRLAAVMVLDEGAQWDSLCDWARAHDLPVGVMTDEEVVESVLAHIEMSTVDPDAEGGVVIHLGVGLVGD